MSEQHTVGLDISEAERLEVAKLPQQVMTAWAEHDADAFARLFTEAGTMILPGLYLKGRDAIRTFLTQAFEGPYKGTRVTGTPIDIRFSTAVSGVLVTSGGVLAPGDTEPSAERAVYATWVVVKRDGAWQLAAYQNSPQNAG
ncbi:MULTISPECIES: SgcJ/EcaC family oxidoreductase [unclassified Streptomyces]|uniref:SgcJ/EcaC family oxidoreductase n=1 Tax=unclassified Streptomyces TaxID=2593676 RepID=UPI000CD4EC30|nr:MULTISPECIES: SgcJ/EcaC family oxidoreductase [unclassified Streptomyces]